MSEFKSFDGGEPFVQPERPFLLIYKNKEDVISYSWLEDEEELQEVAKEIKSYGCNVIEAIEIASCRNIVF